MSLKLGCSQIVKRSLNIRGHKTSVSLEKQFWLAFLHLANERGMTRSKLAEEIDDWRNDPRHRNDNLSSAIRVYIWNDLRARIDKIQLPPAIGMSPPMQPAASA